MCNRFQLNKVRLNKLFPDASGGKSINLLFHPKTILTTKDVTELFKDKLGFLKEKHILANERTLT